MEWARCIVLYLTFFWRFFWRFLLLLQTQIQIQTPQNLLQPKILLNRKVSVMSGDTKMKNVLVFLHAGVFPKSDFWFLRNLQNFPKTQTQAQDAQNLLQSKSWLNSKVSVMSEDTGNVKFVQNYNREKILEKSLFWVEEPGCSSRTQNPAHQSAIFSAKQGVTPGGNDLELFLGQSWVSSQKMGSVSRKTKNAIFFAFYQNPENIQRGDPWKKKNSKCSNLGETCRTGRGHQKNKLGSVFATVLHCRWWKKSEIGQKCSRRMPRNHQKWRIFFKIDFFS